MLTLGAAAFTADHGGSVRARSLSALSQWPSLLSRQPARLSMWISPRRNARSRGGLSELRWVRPAFRVADWRDPDALRGAVLHARRKRIVADMPKGSDVVPRGLSSPPQPVRISPNSVHRVKMMGIWISCSIMRGALQGSAFIPHFQGTRSSIPCTRHAFSVKYSLDLFNQTFLCNTS